MNSGRRRGNRRTWRAALCGLGLCLAVALIVAACGGGTKVVSVPTPTRTTATTASTSSNLITVASPVARTHAARADLQSVFEDEGLLDADNTYNPAKVPAAMATFRALGVQTLRVFVPWSYLAPSPYVFTRPAGDLSDPATYSTAYWAYLDAVVRAGRADHIRILFDVGAPAPYWAMGKHIQTAKWRGSWKPDAALFGDFMHAIGERYSGSYVPAGQTQAVPRVDDWSIWNEPNGNYLSPNVIGAQHTVFNARLYRAIVDAAWTGLASTGHTPARDTILIGETAPRGVRNPGLSTGVYPLIFIRALYCVSSRYTPLTGQAATALGCPASGSPAAFRADNPGLFDASGWADHPYSDVSAPNVEAPAATGSANDADFAGLSRLGSSLDSVFSAYGSTVQLPIYSTEYGYITDPPSDTGVSNTLAARYMNQAEYLSWTNPRIRSYSQYLLVDPSENDSFATGLENPTSTAGVGTPKPDVYDAYRLPLWLPSTSASSGQKLIVWGCARPANTAAESSPTVEIQFAAKDSSSYATVKTVTLDPARGGCYFETSVPFSANGTVRLSYDDAGTVIHSRTQAVTVKG